MDAILAEVTAQHGRLSGLLETADWRAPSPCPGWDVADVVLHLAQTDELAVASLEGTFEEALAEFGRGLPGATDIDEGAGLAVERDRGASDAEVVARWVTAAEALRRLAAEVDPRRRVPWVAGEMAARTLLTTRYAEAWIHTDDVARALGVAPEVDDGIRHIVRLAWRTLPYAFERSGTTPPGAVALELRAPSGATWRFGPDVDDPTPPVGTIRGPALDLCLVAGQRLTPEASGLDASTPAAAEALGLIRTFA